LLAVSLFLAFPKGKARDQKEVKANEQV
jgi:hypothetical protein